MFPKEVLNKIRWTGNPELSGVEIWVLHRGAPDDRKVVTGGEVLELENSFFVVVQDGTQIWGGGRYDQGGGRDDEGGGWDGEGNGRDDEGAGGETEVREQGTNPGSGKETRIPYHRVQKIFLDKELIYDRASYRE